MVNANAIHQILSSPGALVQDFDGSFFVLTNRMAASSETGSCKTESNISLDSSVRTWPGKRIFTPSFFKIYPSAYQNFEICLKFERKILIEILEKVNETSFAPHPSRISPSHWEVQPVTDFEEDFTKIQKQIQQGQLEKAVVMTTERSQWQPTCSEKVLLLLNLLKKCPPHLWIYAHWTETSGVIGATPEILFYRQGRKIQTMALAGTLPKGKDLELSTAPLRLLEDQKERHEHQIVIDDLIEKLRPQTAKISVVGPRVIELPHLFHLQTMIEGDLHAELKADFNSDLQTNTGGTSENRNFDFQLIQRLHPSSALGLHSRHLPWQWLSTLKGHQNLSHFGAPLGIPLDNGYLCLVAIRNLEWNLEGSTIRAGCGLVKQSLAQREWQELWAKRESVKALLGLNQ